MAKETALEKEIRRAYVAVRLLDKHWPNLSIEGFDEDTAVALILADAHGWTIDFGPARTAAIYWTTCRSCAHGSYRLAPTDSNLESCECPLCENMSSAARVYRPKLYRLGSGGPKSRGAP